MKNIFAEIITIGDEILYGHITDTNTQWISNALDQNGIKIIRKSSVGDQKEEILNILREAVKRSDIILITGGLGPTNDDITKATLADFFKASLVLHTQALEDLSSYFKIRGRELTDLNKTQAVLPDICTYIPNTCGTAPGMWFEKEGKVLMSMPGVPFEMKTMMSQEVIPRLKKRYNTAVIYHKFIKTIGIGESYLADKISGWESKLPVHIKLAYLPAVNEVTLRLSATGKSLSELEYEVKTQTDLLSSIISSYIYGTDQDTLPQVLGRLLKSKDLKIATAESCTGGYIGHLITSIPGSSAYYKGSIIAYHNDIKQDMLDVQKNTIFLHGAVSEETVKEMAEGVRKKLSSDIGIASSGIAGPDGGTETKPVGTIWLAYSDSEKTITKKLSLGSNREMNIKYTAMAALTLAWQSLSKKS